MKKVIIIFTTILLFAVSAFAVDFTIDLTDDYGDGWNGGMLDLLVNGVVVLDDITIATGYGPDTFVFSVEDGDLVEINYTAGGWADENAYYVYDNAGTLVASSGDGGVVPDAYLSFTAVVAGSTLAYTVDLTDDFGDGWNGGTLDVTVAGVLVLDDITIATGYGPDTFTFDVNVGDLVELDYVAGGWPEENAYYVYDETGVLVVSSGDGGVDPDAHVEFVVGGGGITNDFCVDAEVVGEVTDYLFDTTDATTSGFDTHNINQDLWYVYTATDDGTITVDICESLFDTKIAVYGECDVATELGYNDDSYYCINTATSAIEDIPVVNGEDYYIQVGGYSSYFGEGYLTIVLTSSFVPEPPTNLFVTEEAYATWEAPGGGPGGDEIIHHNGYDVNGIGTGGAADFICLARFDGAQLAPYYDTHSLTEVNITVHSLDYSYLAIQVYEGGTLYAPGPVVYSEDITGAAVVAGENFNHVMTAPVPLISGNDYYLGYEIHATGDHPAAIDAGPMVVNYGAWMFFGGAWYQLTDLGALDYNWVVSGIVSAGVDEIAIKKGKAHQKLDLTAIMPNLQHSQGEMKATHNSSKINAVDNLRDLIGYNTYIDGVQQNTALVTELFYQYEGLVDGTTYLAQVTAVYDEGESDPIDYTFTYVEPEAPAVFFSEYIEGSSNNKALEIYNGTGDVINLDDFRINQSVNGGGWEYQHIFPAGATVADSDVWVILNDGTDPILFDPADADEILAYPSVVHHNGDDARGLEYSEDGGVTWILIDVIGVPTEDPGDGWDVAGVTAATKNHTLVRKEEIVMGNTDWAASAGTTPEDSEWIVYDEDTFEYLGEHPSGTTLNPPTNLFVTEEGYATWEPPSSGAGEWISWDDGANAGAVGLTSGGDWAIASRWDPAAIAPYDGMYLTSVNFFPKSASTGYEIKVWTGADATNLVLAQAVPTFNVDEWNEIVLDTPILIDAADEFWFGVQILGQPVGEYPAARDAGPAVAWYGDMITMDGVTWAPLSGYGLDYNWNIQGYVEAVDGETFVMNHKRVMPNQERTAKPIIDLEMKKLSSRLFTNVSNPISKHAYENLQQNRDLLGYNVYLDDMTTPITYTTDPECLLTDYATLENGTEYIAGVSAVYDEGESDLIYYTFTYVEGVITNDFCEDAEVVGEVTDYLFDTTDATTSGFDTHSINQDLWYVYTATGDGTMTVDVCESLFDTKLAVYGECDVATELGYNDDSSYCIDYATSAIEDIPVVNGEDYYIQVGGFGSYYGEGYLTIVLTSTFVPNPPTNVAVNPEIALLTWDPPVGAEIYFDDFESYTLGGYLAEQSDEWTTWSGAVGGPEDAFIVDTQAFSPTQSVLVEGASTDLVHLYGDLTTGMYNLGIYMYIEPGYGGYFNILHEFTGDRSRDDRHEWALETYFASDGTGYINAGGAEAATFTYPTGTWFECSAIINLDDDLAEYYIDGVYVHDWQWSLTALGNPGLCQIGAMDIFAAAPTGDSPMFYFDDVAHLELVDPTGYNVYLTNMVTPVANLGSDITEYEFEGLTPLQEYTVGVSADYDGEESEIIQVTFIYDPQLDFYPPTNPAAEVVDYNDVLLTWEAPSGAAEWMRWDSGENADAIGLTSGGTFYVASHWDPADLTVYDGATISKIEYFPNDVGDYIMYVWTGPNAGTLVTTEVVTTPTIGEFQEIILSTPVTIDASTELWFGYEVTHAAGAYPAGCDAGPAIAGYGDMISFDATAWDPMSSLGLDYNWNLGAFVEGADGEVVVLRKPHKTIGSVEKAVSRNSVINHNLFSCVQTSHVRETRSLTGYNIYKDGGIYDSVDDATILEYIDTAQDAGTYEYTVTAVYTSPDGESVHTDPVTATVVLNPPTDAVAQSIPPNIMVTWVAPARGIDSYTVLRNGDVVGEDIGTTMFTDFDVPTGEYIYNVIAVYDGGWESELSNDAYVDHVDGDDILKPTETALTGNYPNPFNPTTTISFSLKEAGNVSINIYNMKGQLVKTLVNGELDNAYHKIVWDGKDNSGKNIASGVYFYKMKAQDYNSTKKMILMK